MFLYESPCNERIRTLLRVEYLFDRLQFFSQAEDPRCHQVALSTLFDLLDICERADIRTAVLQDMDRHRSALSALREHPGVDRSTLDTLLQEIAHVSSELAGQGRLGQYLRENEWLTSLRGRASAPGGVSPIEVPSFNAWQLYPAARRAADIQDWTNSLAPLRRCVALILQLVRDAGDVCELRAELGAYQEMLGGKSFQLLRVWVDPKLAVFPEISANKHVIWVRFVTQGADCKPQPAGRSVDFKMARCNL